MILLDTNVISELMRPQPEPKVLAWADAVIAATALAHGACLATSDGADFADLGLALINPWNPT